MQSKLRRHRRRRHDPWTHDLAAENAILPGRRGSYTPGSYVAWHTRGGYAISLITMHTCYKLYKSSKRKPCSPWIRYGAGNMCDSCMYRDIENPNMCPMGHANTYSRHEGSVEEGSVRQMHDRPHGAKVLGPLQQSHVGSIFGNIRRNQGGLPSSPVFCVTLRTSYRFWKMLD